MVYLAVRVIHARIKHHQLAKTSIAKMLLCTNIFIIMSAMPETTNQTTITPSLNTAETVQVNDAITIIDAGDEVSNSTGPSQDYHEITAEHLNEVTDILRRPYKLFRTKYATTTPTGDRVSSSVYSYLSSAIIAPYLQKYYSFKATLCFQLRINSQPFQTGGLLAYYIPPCLDSGSPTYPRAFEFLGFNAQSLPFISGLPGTVCMNISTDSVATIRVPLKWIMDMIPMQQMLAGVFGYSVLQPLGSKTPADFAEVTGYVWLEDFRVEGINQKALSQLAYGTLTTEESEGEFEAPTKAKEAGMMSKASSAVRDISGMLTGVPGIGAVAGVTSIVADIASKGFAFLGLSKPATQEPVTSIQTQHPYGHANCDGVFNGTKLTVNRNQEIPLQQLGLTSEDEMSIQHVAQKPVKWAAFNWKTGQASQTQLTSFQVYPGRFKTTHTDPSVSSNIAVHTYLSYLSCIFNLFRGPIKIKFSFLANPFYSGRLRVVFTPSGDSIASTNLQTVVNYSAIFDIKDANEFEFEIPYVLTSDYINTIPSANTYTPGNIMGRLSVWVENELRTNPACPDSIWVWMDVSAGVGAQFSVPRLMDYIHPNPSYYTPPPVLEAEGEFESVSAGNDGYSTNQFIQSIGDPIGSLRALLKRYMNTDVVIPANEHFQPAVAGRNEISYFSWITSMYGFQTGGMRLWVPTHEEIQVKLSLLNNGSFTPGSTITSTQNSTLVQLEYNANDMLDIEVPYYNVFPRVTAGVRTTTETGRNYLAYVAYDCPLTTVVFDKTVQNSYRAAADDFNCGYLLGPRFSEDYPLPTPEAGAVAPTLTITAP